MSQSDPQSLDIAAAPERALARGMQHHGAGDLDAADAVYRKVLEVHPRHPDALHLHGLVAHQRGRHQQAVDLIGQAVSQNPGNPGYQNNLGEAYRALRRFAEAIGCYRKALQIQPGDTNALNNLGLALHHSHRFDEAESALSEALQLAPTDPEIRVNIGNLYRDRGDLSGAAGFYRQAIAHAPGYPAAHAWLGVTLYELGDGDGAVTALGHATELSPLDLEAHNNLKRVRWNLNQAERLHDSFRRACELLPQVPDTHLNLAESLLLNDEAPQAEAAARRGLSLAPRSARAHSLLGRVLAAMGKLDAAIAAHQRALDLDPDDPLLREDFANALLAAKDFQRTREVLLPGLQAAPRRSGILAHLTIAMAELGDQRLPGLVDYQRYVHAHPIEVPDGFADLESFNAALHQELAAQHLTPNHALEQTMRGGTQTLNNLFQQPTGLVAVLEAQIRKVADAFIAGLPSDPSDPFLRYAHPDYVFTGAWSTIMSGGGYDGSHIHNEGWLSGTYYVQTPPLTPEQHARREGYIQFGEPPQRFVSERNATHRAIAPQVGMAVLFPSYYWHGVRAFHGAGSRHSVSYDII
jgi:uncharacterized protein (TIGR02466 family)